uniref:Uncharacterized protein n=1 Tax=Rhizophora mucronata TaxID=61149 RepID=A0A2P2NN07_RHIMU
MSTWLMNFMFACYKSAEGSFSTSGMAELFHRACYLDYYTLSTAVY